MLAVLLTIAAFAVFVLFVALGTLWQSREERADIFTPKHHPAPSRIDAPHAPMFTEPGVLVPPLARPEFTRREIHDDWGW